MSSILNSQSSIMQDSTSKIPEQATRAETPGQRLARRVRASRRARGWSLEKLSLACGVSRSMLSQIERCQASPTLAVTSAIADAFGVTLGELVDAPAVHPPIDVGRLDDSRLQLRSDAECSIRVLTPMRFEGDLEVYEVRLEPSHSLTSEPHRPGTREVVVVLDGSVTVVSGGEAATVAAGESASYQADIPHAIVNHDEGVASLVLVDAYV
jgi:transcriptional regulator with XRE-family HTH domain